MTQGKVKMADSHLLAALPIAEATNPSVSKGHPGCICVSVRVQLEKQNQ